MRRAQFYCNYCEALVPSIREESGSTANLLVLLILVVLGFVTCGVTWILAVFWVALWACVGVANHLLGESRCVHCGCTSLEGAKHAKDRERIRAEVLAGVPPPLPELPAKKSKRKATAPQPSAKLAAATSAISESFRRAAAPFMALSRDTRIATIMTATLITAILVLVVMSSRHS